MSRFLVIHSDDPSLGRGSRGQTLANFLRCFAGYRNVRELASSELSRRRSETAECVFIGVPTRLKPEQLSLLMASQIILFAYTDAPDTTWGASDSSFLLSLTNRYFKTCVEPQWDPSIHWGCLPVQTSWKLTLELWKRSVREWRGGGKIPKKEVDIGLIGGSDSFQQKLGSKKVLYPQHLKWMKELACQNRWTKWGGICVDKKGLADLQDRYGNVSDIICRQSSRLTYRKLFQKMSASKVMLAPAGRSRWTRRLHEAVYARSMILSTDLSESRLLIPQPVQNLVYVEDHKPVSPFIPVAHSLFNVNPDCVLDAERELERYLRFGQYSRQRPRVWERFEEELIGISFSQTATRRDSA